MLPQHALSHVKMEKPKIYDGCKEYQTKLFYDFSTATGWIMHPQAVVELLCASVANGKTPPRV